MRKFLLSAGVVFVVAFTLNLLWEHLHAPLYLHYRGGAITAAILLRAAIFDAGFIAAVFVLTRALPRRARSAALVFVCVAFAVGLEWFALRTGRWAYADAMPLVPFVGVGVSPSVQLGLTGWFASRVAKVLDRQTSV